MTNQTIKKTNQPSHLKDLILLFAIPIGIAVFALIAVYMPQLLANPKYDFVYSICDRYDCEHDFEVDDSGYISQRSDNRDYYNDSSTLRYYSAQDNSTRNLTLEEAERYQLDTSSKSPDGYTLTREESHSSFLFWSNSESGWYLKDGMRKKKIELSADDYRYKPDVKFLGWIKQ